MSVLGNFRYQYGTINENLGLNQFCLITKTETSPERSCFNQCVYVLRLNMQEVT